jgi:hypothetical protein
VYPKNRKKGKKEKRIGEKKCARFCGSLLDCSNLGFEGFFGFQKVGSKQKNALFLKKVCVLISKIEKF